ncbi:MAG: SAM-dependent chlorinase/fluorinase [Endomicrobiia bacterium]
MKKFIVLLTDFGNDFYVGQMKGVIKNINPDVEILDLCHNIQPQNILQAMIILGSSYKFFPKGSIFICVVDPEVGSNREIILLRTPDYIFISPNNGVLSEVIRENKVDVYNVINDKYFLKPISNTFHGRDIMSPVAAYVSKGVDIKKIACKINIQHVKIFEIANPLVIKRNNCIEYIGRYLFHDSFGNIITNLKKDFINKEPDGKFFVKVKCNTKTWKVRLHKFYSQVKEKELLAYINSFGYIEVALNKADAYKYFSKFGDLSNFLFILNVS